MSVLQAAVLLFYISLAYIKDGVAPILSNDNFLYVNPLPHVLMLTAIVVGVATLSLGLALVVLINKEEEHVVPSCHLHKLLIHSVKKHYHHKNSQFRKSIRQIT